MRIVHLTTVDMSLRYLLLPQLGAAAQLGEAIGISAPGPFVGALEERGIRHIPLHSSTRGMSPLADLRAAGELWSILKRERPDILHTHNPKPGVYGRILGRLAGVPIVVNTVHGLYVTPESPLLKKAVVYILEAIAARFSDAELIQNPEDLELLGRLRIVPSRKMRLLGNGVDLSRFNLERARARRQETRDGLGIGSDDVVVGMVGRLVTEKGVPELIQAAEILSGSASFVIVGPDDPEKSDSLERDVIQRGVQAGVRFLGITDDVEDLYGAFDIFVLPSHREGYPRAAMEAAASGLPLVLTDIRGCRQVVDHGVNGLLVPVGDVERLAAAISTLVENPDLRARMGTASAERAKRLFDETKVVEIVVETYRELAGRKGLAWQLGRPTEPPVVRPATQADSRAVAQLHARMIDTGFLSSLGVGILELVYEVLISSRRGMVKVAESNGTVVGFIAGADDTGAFYREFLRRRGLSALWRLLPKLVKPSISRRAWETLRYGGESSSVSAELLALAVAPGAQRHGLGMRLVSSLQSHALDGGMDAMRVVVGADNAAAIDLYLKSGFERSREIELHTGVRSLEMVWHC